MMPSSVFLSLLVQTMGPPLSPWQQTFSHLSHLIKEFIWPDSCQCPPLGILHRTFPGWVYPGRTPGSPCTSWSPVWAQWRPEVSWSSRHWPDQCCPSLRSCTPSLQTDWSTPAPGLTPCCSSFNVASILYRALLRMKTQRKARIAPSRRLWVPWAVTLCHKRAGVATHC